jgi:hypothetical protein
MSDNHGAEGSVCQHQTETGKEEITEAPTRRLACFFSTENSEGEIIPNPNNSTEHIFLEQEKGKKSSFLFEPKVSTTVFYTLQKPAIIVIEYESPSNGSLFLGGFQMVSSAKTVEIYLTDLQGNESYLTTSKGIPFNKEDKSVSWYKTICVVPGGPRPISRLRMKLLSLRPTDASLAKLQFIKLTARIAESPSQSSLVTEVLRVDEKDKIVSPASFASDRPSSTNTVSKSNRNVFFANPEAVNAAPHRQQSHSEYLSSTVTQSDLGAAMAGVSFLTRSTEKGIEEALNKQTQRMENYFGSCFTRMEQQIHFLQRNLVLQQQLILENHEIIKKQQQTIENQNAHLRILLNQQDDLKVRVQSLQTDMAIVRYQRFEPGNKINGKREYEKYIESEEKRPPVMEIGTRVRDVGEDEDEIVSQLDGDDVVGQSGKQIDIQLENINLKDLIRKTAEEIDQQPLNFGPIIDPESCQRINEPNCGTLTMFKGMMLTDEELRYQRMSAMSSLMEESEGIIASGYEAKERNYGSQAEEEVCVNIEVTLMEEEGDGDFDEEGDEGNDEEEYQVVVPHQPLGGGEFVNRDCLNDKESNVVETNTTKEASPQTFEEKKDMEPVDAPEFTS